MPRDGTIEVAGTLTGDLSTMETLSGELQTQETLSGMISLATERLVPGDYPPLRDKPSVNGEVLLGDKSFEDLGVSTMTNIQIKNIFDRVFRKGE